MITTPPSAAPMIIRASLADTARLRSSGEFVPGSVGRGTTESKDINTMVPFVQQAPINSRIAYTGRQHRAVTMFHLTHM